MSYNTRFGKEDISLPPYPIYFGPTDDSTTPLKRDVEDKDQTPTIEHLSMTTTYYHLSPHSLNKIA